MHSGSIYFGSFTALYLLSKNFQTTAIPEEPLFLPSVEVNQNKGKHFDLELSLVRVLKRYYENTTFWSKDDEVKDYWIHQVGGAQRLLPAHIVQEYCSPRGELTLEKINQRPFHRQLKTDEGDWWRAEYNEGPLGGSKGDMNGFACLSGGLELYPVSCSAFGFKRSGRLGNIRDTNRMRIDHSNLLKLHEVRTAQLEEIQLFYAQYTDQHQHSTDCGLAAPS